MDGFEKWIQFVEQAARQAGKAFVYEIFEGNEMPNPPDGMEVQDLSGYLAEARKALRRCLPNGANRTANCTWNSCPQRTTTRFNGHGCGFCGIWKPTVAC